jgi:hypothetical protein
MSPLLLFNSLTHLTYLMSTSLRICKFMWPGTISSHLTQVLYMSPLSCSLWIDAVKCKTTQARPSVEYPERVSYLSNYECKFFLKMVGRISNLTCRALGSDKKAYASTTFSRCKRGRRDTAGTRNACAYHSDSWYTWCIVYRVISSFCFTMHCLI